MGEVHQYKPDWWIIECVCYSIFEKLLIKDMFIFKMLTALVLICFNLLKLIRICLCLFQYAPNSLQNYSRFTHACFILLKPTLIYSNLLDVKIWHDKFFVLNLVDMNGFKFILKFHQFNINIVLV